uniref:Peptidase S1 domain-containing protein n=1 Tax=Acrobeloides nanus TaxID=290746 RepID=A0A914DR57_9BILA
MSIAKVMNHPDFNEETMENNIAIVRLQIPEYISNFIHPICIPENDADMLELKSVLVGPGKNGSLSMTTIFPKSFLAAMIDIQDTNCCKHHPLRPRNFVVNDKNICTGSRGKGSSEGDTGSPLLVNSYGSWYQIGIVSFGMGSNQEIENQDVYPSILVTIYEQAVASLTPLSA